MHPLKKAFFIALGCISLALGTIGIALPILPTVPFYLLTAFCFANSSERLHTWFTHTTVYKKYIGSYFRRRGMTRKAKALLIGTVTAIMLPGFILMDKVPVGRAIMATTSPVSLSGWGTSSTSGSRCRPSPSRKRTTPWHRHWKSKQPNSKKRSRCVFFCAAASFSLCDRITRTAGSRGSA